MHFALSRLVDIQINGEYRIPPRTSAMQQALPDEIHEEIKRICSDGDRLVKTGEFKTARERYWAAFDLLPEPREDWEAATWIVAAIGDSFYVQKDYLHARDAFMDAVRCPGGLGNVFIHMRLGECNLELGDERLAADDLTRAYMGGGREAFKDEDPKYFALLERLLEPPAGQDHL